MKLKNLKTGWYYIPDLPEDIPKKIYKATNSKKHAGYVTYKPTSIYIYNNLEVVDIYCLPTRLKNKNCTNERFRFDIEDDELVAKSKNVFTKVHDYFLYREKIGVLDNKQYQFELNEVKQKYPEYFL